MGKTLEGRAVGSPDFVFIPQSRIHTIRSDKDQHFTGSLAKNASEEENLAGLEVNKIVITELSIRAKQALRFQLLFFSKDSFTDPDIDDDTFARMVNLDLSLYGKRVLGGAHPEFWTPETAWPEAFTNISLSNIYLNDNDEPELYLVEYDSAWRYNLATKAWTQIATPALTKENVLTPAVYRNGKLYVILEGSAFFSGGRRIGVYDPISNTWVYSSQAPDITGTPARILDFCFQDDDTIWAWVSRSGGYFKCFKYVISTDTWSQFSNNLTPSAGTGYATSAGYYNGAVYMVYPVPGAAADICYLKYVVSTAAYSESAAHLSVGSIIDYGQAGPYLLMKVSYSLGATANKCRIGYFDCRDQSWHDAYYPLNTAYTGHNYGSTISEDLAWAFDYLGTSAPQHYSYSNYGYCLNLKGLAIPYEDLDKTKELHIALKNLSPTSKSARADGEVVVEVGYELAS